MQDVLREKRGGLRGRTMCLGLVGETRAMFAPVSPCCRAYRYQLRARCQLSASIATSLQRRCVAVRERCPSTVSFSRQSRSVSVRERWRRFRFRIRFQLNAVLVWFQTLKVLLFIRFCCCCRVVFKLWYARPRSEHYSTQYAKITFQKVSRLVPTHRVRCVIC